MPYNVFGDVAATCSSGHIAFGGFKTDTVVPFGTGSLLWPAGMGPLGSKTNRWSTVAAAPGVSGGKLTSIAYCGPGKAPKVVKKTKLVLQSAANDVFRSVTATCPTGTVVTGGGWSARAPSPLYGDEGQPRVNLMELRRVSSRSWRVSVVNERPAMQSVTAIALCGKGPAPKEVQEDVQIPAGNRTSTATATCPGSRQVAFGGLRGTYEMLSGRNAFPVAFFRASKKSISVRGVQNYVFGQTKTARLTAFAYCR